MKRIPIAVLLMILLTRPIFGQTAIPPAVGDGSAANPYQIATLENLYWIVSTPGNMNYYFIQTADINASQTSSWSDSMGQGWPSIGVYGSPYRGRYDGMFHTIDSLFINRPNYDETGLFGTIAGEVRNLGLTHVNIHGGRYAGGLAGGTQGLVQKCFSTGYVNGQTAGGLLGFSGPWPVSNCYSTATVEASGTAGGIVGQNLGCEVIDSYAAGRVNGAVKAGGLIGDEIAGSFVVVYNSFWDLDSSGQSNSAGGKGKSTLQMKSGSLYVDACWDSAVWAIDPDFNGGYPYFSWQRSGGTPLPGGHVSAPAFGDGSSSNPYQMATLENLNWLASNPSAWGSYFLQIADIDASRTRGYSEGEGWMPVGGPTGFHGTYHGNGHIIDSLYINRPEFSEQGLFGAAQSFKIDSLGVTNVDVTGKTYIGGVVGHAYTPSSVGHCYSTGKVDGTGDDVGGLIGDIYNHVIVTNCYSRASIQGVSNVGGLIGMASYYSSIDRSYSAGAVSGSSAGGLLGRNHIDDPIPASCFWDIETSGQTWSAGGTGRTMMEMKTAGTFSGVGWSSAYWDIDSTINDGYPYLSWQNPNGTPLPLLPGFIISASSVSFGIIPLGSSSEDSVLVSNPGTDTLRVTGISSTNQIFEASPSSMALAPSGSAHIYISFSAQDTMLEKGFIVLTHNASLVMDSLAVSGQGANPTAVKKELGAPTEFALHQNYPNPFNPSTVVEYAIPQTVFVSIRVFDVLGQSVAQLESGVKRPGRYSVRFDGSHLASGLYLCSIDAGSFHQVRKMLLVK